MKYTNGDIMNILKAVGWLFAIVIVINIIGVGLGIVGWGFGFLQNGGEVAKKEFYPDALLKKYEWFKDASAQLDNKQATIKVLEQRIINLKNDYGNKTRDQWARNDRESYNQWTTEVAGVKASYNSLAAEYNAQMVKFNWKFTNVGDMPPGAENPLPREYKQYIEE